MIRKVVMAVLGAALLMPPGPALAQQGKKIGKWYVGYDEPGKACFMRVHFTAGAQKTTISIETFESTSKLLQISNSSWTMPQRNTTVEIWYDRNWQRPADAIKNATLHHEDGKTYLDIAFKDADLDRIAKTDWLIVREPSAGIFTNYDLGATAGAIDALWGCDDEWDYWF